MIHEDPSPLKTSVSSFVKQEMVTPASLAYSKDGLLEGQGQGNTWLYCA